ncbi:MAG TPA: molybdopterin cofactor-binding domain-containing protein, partial [Steroidobacter sp.]|nr:molybdopterin cofactor-binding domain-containing protein [Steroidobacter sp.]
MSAVEQDTVIQATRRDVLKGSAVLTVAMWLPSGGVRANNAEVTKAGTFVPNAFVRIDQDSTVTVLSKHVEMGQGSYTGLATIVAEELDADW